MGSSPLTVGLLVFPDLTQLDLTGPYEVFSRAPGMRVLLVGTRCSPTTPSSTPSPHRESEQPGSPACAPGRWSWEPPGSSAATGRPRTGSRWISSPSSAPL